MRYRSGGLVVAIAFAFTVTLSAQTGGIWTQLANTGEVDEADRSLYQASSNGTIALRSGALGTVDVRFSLAASGEYGVIGEPGEEDPLPCVRVRASMRDTGPGARVIVRLKELDIHTGAIRTLAELDTDRDNVASPEYVLYSTCASVDERFPFNFEDAAYFLDAQLIKTSQTANPGLRIVQVCHARGCTGE
jgi:hypothetical protein